jgi:tetraacyldisaccharide 4'-kinase
MDVRLAIARGLEAGVVRGRCADLASRAWAAWARVERPLTWRENARVVAIGGSTLGGSGKTPLAIACAEELHARGARLALVGHAYAASPGRARIVSLDDDVRVVGDEALVCARRLAPLGVEVVVGRSRQEALDLALREADVAVVDGLCQTTPRRATLALLALHASAPWGAGHCPPRGDLRAPVEKLLSSADRVVLIGGQAGGERSGPFDTAQVVSAGAWLPEPRPVLLDWASLRGPRVGLWTCLARPERLVGFLATRGIRLSHTRFGPDHGVGANHGKRSRVCLPHIPDLDLWLTTAKCRTHLPPPPLEEGIPVATLDHAVRLSAGLCSALRRTIPS